MVWVPVARAILCGLEKMCGLRVNMRAHRVLVVVCAMDIHSRWTACLNCSDRDFFCVETSSGSGGSDNARF